MAPKNRIWTDEAEEFLISFVEMRPCLYNPKDEGYHRTNAKNLLFKECAELMGRKFTSTMVKDRWANLRGTFVTNHKKALLASEEDPDDRFGDGQPTWPLYHRLHFLIGCLHIQRLSKSQDITNTEDPGEADDSMEELPRKTALTFQRLATTPPQLSAETPADDHNFYAKRSQSQSNSERPYTREPSQNQSDFGKAVLELLEKGRDANYHFGMCVAASLRNNMTGLDRERAKCEIQSVLIKYHRDNVKE